MKIDLQPVRVFTYFVRKVRTDIYMFRLKSPYGFSHISFKKSVQIFILFVWKVRMDFYMSFMIFFLLFFFFIFHIWKSDVLKGKSDVFKGKSDVFERKIWRFWKEDLTFWKEGMWFIDLIHSNWIEFENRLCKPSKNRIMYPNPNENLETRHTSHARR